MIDVKRVQWKGLSLISLLDQGFGEEAKNSTFSEYGHVAYQIKGNNAYSNMVANILPTGIPLIPGVGTIGKHIFILKIASLPIKLKGTERIAPTKRMFCSYTHHWSLGLGQKAIFLKWLCCISNQREGSVDQHAKKTPLNTEK